MKPLPGQDHPNVVIADRDHALELANKAQRAATKTVEALAANERDGSQNLELRLAARQEILEQRGEPALTIMAEVLELVAVANRRDRDATVESVLLAASLEDPSAADGLRRRLATASDAALRTVLEGAVRTLAASRTADRDRDTAATALRQLDAARAVLLERFRDVEPEKRAAAWRPFERLIDAALAPDLTPVREAAQAIRHAAASAAISVASMRGRQLAPEERLTLLRGGDFPEWLTLPLDRPTVLPEQRLTSTRTAASAA